MEFDKSRIYDAVNADELKPGDKVIVSDCLRFLRQDVKEGGDIETLKEVLDESHLQRFKVMDDLEWGLAYLVERSENCTNCKEGRWDAEHKKILCDPVNCGNGNVIFRNHEIEVCEYYKPITKQKVDMPELIPLGNGQYVEKKHYRPFHNTDELIEEWDKKLGYRDPTGLAKPYIWVRSKFNEDHKGCLITNFFGIYVMMNNQQCFLSRLFDEYTFLDGSPCGVEA